jgi:hypothetical protein
MLYHADIGYREKMDAVYQTLRGLDKNENYHYLEEMYDDSLIYSKSSKEGVKMYKQSYKYESGKIELVGDSVEVRRKVDYVINASINFKKEDTKMSENKCPKCVEKINALLANKESGFVEADREWLDTLTESALDKITPKVIEKEKIVEKTVEVNKLTPEQTADLAFLAKQRADKRAEMIQGIQANTSKELWPDDVLKGMSEDNLQRLSNSVKKVEEGNYILQGGVVLSANVSGMGEIESLAPTGVEFEDEKK